MERLKVKSPSTHATLLLDVFYTESASIKKEVIDQKKLLHDGQSFTQWRDYLRSKGYIDWSESVFGEGKIKVIYRPGPEMIGILNDIVLSSKEVASKDYVDDKVDESNERMRLEMQAQIEKLKAEMTAIVTSVVNHYLQENPPDNEERRLRLIKNVNEGVPFLEEDIGKRAH
jgi:hypothetical protein